MIEPVYSYPLVPWAAVKEDSGYPFYQGTERLHTGHDYNLKTGGDTDLGYPILSPFPGTVIDASRYSDRWGYAVTIEADPWVRDHWADKLQRLGTRSEIGVLWVRLVHLWHVVRLPGERVEAGDVIGSMGKGGDGPDGPFYAHLHLDYPVRDLRNLPGGFAHWPANIEDLRETFLDPDYLYARVRFADRSNIHPGGQRYAPASLVDVAVETSERGGVITNLVGSKLFVRSNT